MYYTEGENMKNTKLQWHPAFDAALRITLQMDILIIKKLKDVPIRKTIGRIFRKHNIIEYKSPGDSLSINDFYKVYGYACIYQSNTDRIKEIDPQELTLTFVCSHYPRNLLRHLKHARGLSTEDQGGGIYYLNGDPIPMQLLIVPELTDTENYWLQSMRTDLRAGKEIQKLMREYEKHRKSKDYAAVMDLITRANWEQMEVEKKMCDALKELFSEELKEADNNGRTEGIQTGIQQGKREMILAFLKAGAEINMIKEATGLNEEQIEEIRREIE